MDLKKKYYQLNQEEFNNYLASLKNNPETLYLFDFTQDNYFFVPELEIEKKILKIYHLQWQFDQLFNSFSLFSQRQIIQSFLIDEVVSTNQIENIHSTKHDVFYLLNDLKTKDDFKIKSLINCYQALLENSDFKLVEIMDIKKLYDELLSKCIAKQDRLDGVIFRKNEVFVNDGIKNVHYGFYPEEKLLAGLCCFLDVYNSDLEVYLKMILSHFMFETIHPFYDGNGRFGRFIFTCGILKETDSKISFVISNGFNKYRSRYYDCFKQARDIHQFGCINKYCLDMCDIIIDSYQDCLTNLKEKKELIDKHLSLSSFSKTENNVYKLILESSVFSLYGINNKEIMQNTKISKRTLVNCLNKFKEKDMLLDTSISKYDYHKIKGVL